MLRTMMLLMMMGEIHRATDVPLRGNAPAAGAVGR
jgi:hypothetical protein